MQENEKGRLSIPLIATAVGVILAAGGRCCLVGKTFP